MPDDVQAACTNGNRLAYLASRLGLITHMQMVDFSVFEGVN
jgi:hypothetical protein